MLNIRYSDYFSVSVFLQYVCGVRTERDWITVMMMGDSKDTAFEAAADGGRANAVVSRGSRRAKMALAGTMLLLSGGNGVLGFTTNETCAIY